MSKEKTDTLEKVQRFKVEVELIEKYIDVLRNNNDTLKEQLSISQKLYSDDFQKVKNYEDTLYALLHTATKTNHEQMANILLDTLRGIPLEKNLTADKDAGKIIWNTINQNTK